MHLSTGAIGTRLLFPFLSKIGRTDLAAEIAAQSTYPSHGYWITQGATPCWENWSGKADATHGNAQPTHNHIFLGSHAGWQYEFLLGIRQPAGSNGFESLELAPPLIDSLPSMSGKVETVRGEVATSWAWRGEPMRGRFSLNCTVPPNVLATVVIPIPGLPSDAIITEGRRTVWKDGSFVRGVAGVTGGSAGSGTIVISIGSGSYSFETNTVGLQTLTVYGCDELLQCPAGTVVVRIRRAGLADSSAASPLRSRYLISHFLEQHCRGRSNCDLDAISAADAVAPAVSLVLGSQQLCATVVCQ